MGDLKPTIWQWRLMMQKLGAKPLWQALVSALVLTCLAPAIRSAPGAFFTDPLWSDGKAEFSVYSGHMASRQGSTFPVEAKIIVVKEEFDRRQRVKSDLPPDPAVNFTVLKQN